MKRHVLIFEGAELVGKSYVISQVYDWLEKKYSTSKNILNGCHWFNSDVGILGEQYGKFCLEKYLDMAEHLVDRNIIWEKFHVSDMVYRIFYQKDKISYNNISQRLERLGAKIIFCQIDEDESLFNRRLTDRLKLYPHYRRIAKKPQQYIEMQRQYQIALDQGPLPILKINTSKLPNDILTRQIINWINKG